MQTVMSNEFILLNDNTVCRNQTWALSLHKYHVYIVYVIYIEHMQIYSYMIIMIVYLSVVFFDVRDFFAE